MNINTYSFYPIDSNMYVILENKKALIIDPCVSEEAKEYLKSEQVKEILVLLTHEHYDHISGVNWLRECFPQVKVFCSEACANGIVKPTRNLSAYYEILFSSKEEEIREYVKNMDVQPYSCQADETYEGRKEWNWEGHKIAMQETPGHSKGSSCILMDDMYLFSFSPNLYWQIHIIFWHLIFFMSCYYYLYVFQLYCSFFSKYFFKCF